VSFAFLKCFQLSPSQQAIERIVLGEVHSSCDFVLANSCEKACDTCMLEQLIGNINIPVDLFPLASRTTK
jgi:hypothetical protein